MNDKQKDIALILQALSDNNSLAVTLDIIEQAYLSEDETSQIRISKTIRFIQ